MIFSTNTNPNRVVSTSLPPDIERGADWNDLLTNAERNRLLIEIATVALAVGRDLYPGVSPGDLDIQNAPIPVDDICPRERLGYLEAVLPRLLAAAHAIEADPATRAVPAPRRVPTHAARRVSPAALRRALQTEPMLPAPPDLYLAARLGNRLPRTVDETITIPTPSTPANRMVKAILTQFVDDLGGIMALAATETANENVRQSASHLRARLHSILSRPLWHGLPLPLSPPLLPPALPGHGAYTSVYQIYRKYRRGFCLDWNNPLFNLPAHETWQLYEIWGLFQVVQAIRNLGFRARRADGFGLSRSGLAFRIAPDTALHFVRDRFPASRLSITFQRNFAPQDKDIKNRAAAGWHSRTYPMRPDIVLEREGRLIIFDTKFKTYAPQTDSEAGTTGSRAILSDLQQMHAYRDAIRGCNQPDQRAVVGAWLLYAGHRSGQNSDVIRFPAESEVVFGNGDTGGLLLRPGSDPRYLTALINQFCEIK